MRALVYAKILKLHYYSFKQVAFYYLFTANTEECTLTNQQNVHGWVLCA